MNYNIQVLEMLEHDESYDILIHIYNGEINEKNCIHIMTVTISPKPSAQQLGAEIERAIKIGMEAYLKNRNKKLKNQPTLALRYDEETGKLI